MLDKDETYLLSLESISSNRACVHVGISDPDCPWNDDHRTVKNNKIWARILSKGYFTVQASKFPRSFVIILLPNTENSSCTTIPFTTSELAQNKESKVLKMKITLSSSSFRSPILISLAGLAIPSL